MVHIKSALIVLLACLGIFVSTATAAPETESSKTSACSVETVKKWRSNSSRLMTEGRYRDAAEGLKKVLASDPCSSELYKTAEFLWAKSDLALAYLKDNRPGQCIEVVETELNQYPDNPLEEVGIEKLKSAFAANKRLCEARRKELFPEAPSKSCAIGNLPARTSFKFSSGDERAINFKVGKVERSLSVAPESGFDCIAVIEVATMRGILQDLCDSENECLASGGEDDAEFVTHTELFGLKLGATIALTRLDYTQDSGWYGGPKISLHGDALDGDKPLTEILKVETAISPVGGGTGRAEVRSYFAMKDGKLVPRDLCQPVYH